jgi:hypothetical protein
MGARIAVGVGLVAVEVLQLAYWAFARFATLDHPERVATADRMQLLLAIGLVILPIGFLACLRWSPRGLWIANVCAAASLVLAVAVAAIGAVGIGGDDPLVGFVLTLVLLAAPGLILFVCALAMKRSTAAPGPS